MTLPTRERPSALRLVAARVLTPAAVALVLSSPFVLLAWSTPIAAMVLGGAVGGATLTGEWLGARWLGARGGAAAVAALVPVALSLGALQVLFSIATLSDGMDAGYAALARGLDGVASSSSAQLAAFVGASAGVALPLSRSTFARLSPALLPIVLRPAPIGLGVTALALAFPLSIADGTMAPPGAPSTGPSALSSLIACAGVSLVVVGGLLQLGERLVEWVLQVDHQTPVTPPTRLRRRTWPGD